MQVTWALLRGLYNALIVVLITTVVVVFKPSPDSVYKSKYIYIYVYIYI